MEFVTVLPCARGWKAHGIKTSGGMTEVIPCYVWKTGMCDVRPKPHLVFYTDKNKAASTQCRASLRFQRHLRSKLLRTRYGRNFSCCSTGTILPAGALGFAMAHKVSPLQQGFSSATPHPVTVPRSSDL